MQRKMISAPKPTFTPLPTRLLQHTCACGGSAGFDGFCSECRERKFTSPASAGVDLDLSQHYSSQVQQESHAVEQALIPGSSVSVRPSFGHDFSRVHVHAAVPETIQTKLTVNQPGDQYEQEADQVADKVMRMSEKEVVQSNGSSGDPQSLRIQRMSPQEDEVRRQAEEEAGEDVSSEPMEEEETLQAKASPGHVPTVTPELHARIDSLRGGGQPLDAATRAYMEPRFGHDFSQVRIHTDERAAETAREVNALAYTVGRDMVFGVGQYEPGTSEGQRLIAHELTHVVQQSNADGNNAVQRNEKRGLSVSSNSTSRVGVVVQRDTTKSVAKPSTKEEKVAGGSVPQPPCELSGPAWVARFPTSKHLRDLEEPFQSNVRRFIKALETAGAQVHISATKRPLERAYLMSYSYLIAQGLDPRAVPPRANVNISWVHKDSQGNPDIPASRAAAEKMARKYEIADEPKMTSRHIGEGEKGGRAIDMTIKWDEDLLIFEGGGTGTQSTLIRSTPRTGAANRELWKVGESYGVKKLARDRPHWSDDGH